MLSKPPLLTKVGHWTNPGNTLYRVFSEGFLNEFWSLGLFRKAERRHSKNKKMGQCVDKWSADKDHFSFEPLPIIARSKGENFTLLVNQFSTPGSKFILISPNYLIFISLFNKKIKDLSSKFLVIEKLFSTFYLSF